MNLSMQVVLCNLAREIARWALVSWRGCKREATVTSPLPSPYTRSIALSSSTMLCTKGLRHPGMCPVDGGTHNGDPICCSSIGRCTTGIPGLICRSPFAESKLFAPTVYLCHGKMDREKVKSE